MTVVSVRGPYGSGKTTFGMQWGRDKSPKVFWFDLELGGLRASLSKEDWERITLWHPSQMNGAVGEQARKILIANLTAKKGERLEGREDYLQVVAEKIVDVSQSKEYQLVEFDTFKQMWMINWQAQLESLQVGRLKEGKPAPKNLSQFDYGIPNSRQSNIALITKSLGKDLILISHERPVYVQQTDPSTGLITSVTDPSGRTELDGFNGTLNLADWAFKMWREDNCSDRGKEIARKVHTCNGHHFWLEIEKSPLGVEFYGEKLRNPTWESFKSFVEKRGHQL